MISTRLFFLFALVVICVHAQDYENEQFDPSQGQQQPGLEQFGVQPDFSQEGAEGQFEGGEQFDGGFIQPGQQGQQQFEGGMQPNFAEESQRVSRILPALRN